MTWWGSCSRRTRCGPSPSGAPDPARLERLAALPAARVALAVAPLAPGQLAGLAGLDAVHAAPRLAGRWSEMAEGVARALLLDGRRLPRDGVVLVGEMALEAEWAQAGRLAAWLPAARWFGVQAGGAPAARP